MDVAKKHIQPILTLLLFVLVCLPSTVVHGTQTSQIELSETEKAWLKSHPVIRVASNSAWSPLEFIDEDGHYQGIAINYLRVIEARLGIRFEIAEQQPWHQLVDKAKERSIDMLSCVAQTPARSEYLSFTSPYIKTPVVIFSRLDIPYIGDLAGLVGKKVAVVKGHEMHETLSREHPELTVVTAEDIHAALELLDSGDVFAYVGSLIATSHHLSIKGHRLIKVAGETPYELNVGMACRNDWPVFATILQKGLDSISPEERNTIYRKWIAITYEHGFDYSLIWKIIGSSLLVICGFVFWNRRLSHEVEKKTAAVKLNEERLEALWQISNMRHVTEQELSQYALEEAVRLTRSKGGYFHLYDATTKTITLTNWTRGVMQQCQTAESSQYPLAKAGIWADSIRRDGPVIHNDYAGLPDKKGTPAGHFPLHRHLSVPIEIDNRVMAITGVANKEDPYDESDVRQLTQLMSDSWQIILRRRAQEALQLNEKQYRLLADNAADVIWTTDTAKNITYTSPSIRHLRGYSAEEAMAEPFEQKFVATYLTEVEETFAQVEKSNTPVVFEAEQPCKDGSTVWVEINVHNLLDETGNKIGFIGTSRNITERKQATEEKVALEQQLRQSQKMESIGILAGGIAHDFNNILSALFGYAEMVLDDLRPGSSTCRMQEQVLRATERAKDLVQQILVFSRQTDEGQKPLQPHLIIKEALKLLRPSLPATIEIRQNIPADCGSILADPTQFHQIIMNLCTNAYHAMRDKGGVLTVSLAALEITAADISFNNLALDPGNYIKLEVADTGHGMDQIVLDRIFSPYFTTKAKGEGTGLGMSVVHGIVKNIGGHIVIHSKPGEGASIQIFFPKLGSKALSLEVENSKSLPQGNERILCVDDEGQLLAMNHKMLTSLGCQVTSFTDPHEALQTFQATPYHFDLVITDVTMPHMTGLELAEQLLAVRPELPIIMRTGFSELVSEKQAVELGIKNYLTKPVLRADLANTIRKALGDKKSQGPERSAREK